MIIARSIDESNRLVEQEISHVVCLEKPTLLYEDRYIINNEQMCLFELPDIRPQRTIKTKKYGTVCLFESVRELIESKYNKGIVACYCSDVKIVPKKRYSLKAVSLDTKKETYIFESKEQGDQRSNLFFVDKDYETNKVEGMEKGNAYLVLLERNKFLVNEAQIIDFFKLKG